MKSISLLVRAKANLSLGVRGKDSEGYHNLDMLLVSLADIYDKVCVFESDNIKVKMNGKEVGEENTAFRAVKLIKERYGTTLSAEVEKGIPLSAGLGGSSADAAAIFFAYAKLYGKSLTEMIPLADKVGSDVAFMMFGGTAISRGRGSTLIFKHMPKLRVGVLKAFGGSDTGKVFRKYDEIRTGLNVNNEELLRRINLGEEYHSLLLNDLYESANIINDNIGKLYVSLKEITPYVVMSGSGSSVIAVVEDMKSEEKILDCGQDVEYCHMTNTASKGIVILGIEK